MKIIKIICLLLISCALNGQHSFYIPQPAPVIVANQTSVIQASIGANDIHSNGSVIQFTGATKNDPEWSRVNNVFTFTGTPVRVKGYINLRAEDTGISNYWSRPKIRVLRNGIEIGGAQELVMQQNTAYDGDAMYSDILFVDYQAGANPVYTIEWWDKDNRTATLTPLDWSNITLEAIKP